jgi:type I restriction-modification system DNA methylase subunit
MLNIKSYYCGICKTTPDQISHHKSHIETQKHKDKKELFELKLSKLDVSQLEDKYKTININDIVTETETIINLPNDKETLIKKLKENKDEIISIKLDEPNILKNTMIEQTNSVSNKEALKDKIHEIHNYLRNNGAGYGMNALKVFNLLYGLKKIEENGLLDKVNLTRPNCEFSYLLQLANNSQGERLAELITGNVLQSIYDSELKDLLFYEIPKNIRARVFEHLIKEIDRITIIEKTCNVLLSGKIYEYFIGRDESAISELGAYFTDRHIVDYILKKLDPSKNEDGTISSMIDMFGGSGGFTTGYINYMNDKYPGQIDWTNEINKIHHFDMNEDVIKSAGLEFFCLTGTLPNMDNLRYSNSFTDEFPGDNNKPRKFKYPLTNPPYGGDKNSKSEAQSKREKVKEYIKTELTTIADEGLRIRRQKQLKTIEAQEKQEKKETEKTKVCLTSCSGRIQKFAKLNNLKGNDKESCSLILLMDILEVGGTAIGVLKEGVFFNKAYKDLRKCLVEKFNVREVISVPQDQFENTSTKTSIIIFDNTEEKTSEVKFSELSVERYTEDKFAEIYGDIVIIENKGDILGVNDTLISSASREEIVGNTICSLNGKDYNKKEIVVGEGYELVKLGDISEFKPKSKRNASFGQTTGQYNFYTSSEKIQKCDIADYNEECLIIGDGGVANIKIDNQFSCSCHNHIVKTPYNHYIYYLLSGKIELLSDGFSGSVLKNLSKDYLKNLQISIPKSQSKIQEWVDKISSPYNVKNTKQTQIKELELFVQNRIKEIGENEECDEKTIFELTKMLPNGKHNTSFGKQYGKYKFYNSSNEEKLFCDEYEIEDESIIIGFKGNINIHFGRQFTSSQHMYVLQLNDETNLIFGNIIKYLYNYFKNNQTLFSERMHGTTIKHITKPDLNNIKIKIPKNKQLIQELEVIFQQIETLQNEVKNADELYKQLIKVLSEEAIPQQQQVTQQVVVETNEEIIEKPKKVKRTVKKIKLIVEE